MKKPKSINFSFLILILLFVLSQTAFALTATLSETYDIDENHVLAVIDYSYEYITADQRAQILTGEDLQAAFNAETFSTLQVTVPTIADEQTLTLAESEPAPKPEIKSVVRYVNADKLNVRKEANSDSELVTTIKRGDKVTYYETIGEWARIITWTDKKGYILAKYLVDSAKDVEQVIEPKKTASRGTTTTEKTVVSQPASAEALSLTEKIIDYAKSLQGVKYVWGGYSTKGFDCSGFTKYVFAKFDINVPRSSSEYYGFGTKVARADIRAGDIVLFDIDGGKADVGHVGIYIGGGNFIHASSSHNRVMIRDLATYGEKYMGARRVIK